MIAAASALVVLIALSAWLLLRRRRGPELKQAIEAVSIERLQNVLLPDGMGGHIKSSTCC